LKADRGIVIFCRHIVLADEDVSVCFQGLQSGHTRKIITPSRPAFGKWWQQRQWRWRQRGISAVKVVVMVVVVAAMALATSNEQALASAVRSSSGFGAVRKAK
jgi:hypothetical protein